MLITSFAPSRPERQIAGGSCGELETRQFQPFRKQQYLECNPAQANKCPAGPPGEKGPSGDKGGQGMHSHLYMLWFSHFRHGRPRWHARRARFSIPQPGSEEEQEVQVPHLPHRSLRTAGSSRSSG